jgi:hypothetical protein
MKKFFTVFFLVTSLIIILGSFNFGYGFAVFLFAGIIPGTNLQLSPEQMLMLYAFAIGMAFIRLKPELFVKYNLLIAKQNKSKSRKLKQI